MNFNFDRLIEFRGLEGFPKLLVDPRTLRQAYLEEVANFTSEVRRHCLRNRTDFVQVNTQAPMATVLEAYLAKRMGSRSAG